MLRTLRNNATINKWVRHTILAAQKQLDKAARLWRVCGVVPLQFKGTRFSVFSNCDDVFVDPLFYQRPYVEYDDLTIFTQLMNRNAVVFDIGANTGVYSLILGSMSKEAKVFSFEPNPYNLGRLRRNIELNALRNIEVVAKAVGATATSVSFTVPKIDRVSDTSSVIESFSRGTYKGELEWKNIQVEQISIDAFCKERQVERLDLVKIDVEGYEISVLQGAVESFNRFKPVILLESFLDEEKKVYLEGFVRSNGYFVYLIFSQGIVKSGQIFEDNTGLNYLLLPYEIPAVFTPLSKISSKSSLTLTDNKHL